MMRSLTRSVTFLGLIVATSAVAGSVYLNNVNIDGVTNQKFERATVRIDDKGNIYIDAPGYTAKPVEKGGDTVTAQAASRGVTKRYWLVTEQTAQGMTEFDVDVYINSKWIRKVRSSDEQLVIEISKYLSPGRNTVLFSARKNVTGARKSFSPDHVFRFIIGEGNVGGDNVMIDNTLAKFERTAAESNNVSKEFIITAQ